MPPRLSVSGAQVTYLFWQGTRCQTILNHKLSSGPSPMLAVLGLKPEALEALVAGTNKRLKLDAASSMMVSLVNTWDAMVVSGKPESLSTLLAAIEKESASPDEPQGRIPSSQRKPVVTTSFLRVTGALCRSEQQVVLLVSPRACPSRAVPPAHPFSARRRNVTRCV